MNPDAADATNFVSIFLMQAKRIVAGALGIQLAREERDDSMPMVLDNKMPEIDDEDYWDIFEGYFDLPSDSDDEGEGEDEGEESKDAQEAEAPADAVADWKSRTPPSDPGIDVLPEDTVGAIMQRIEDVDEQQRLFQSQQVATLAQMMKQQNEMMTMLSELRAAVPAGGEDVSTPKDGKDADDEKGGKKGKKGKKKVKKGK